MPLKNQALPPDTGKGVLKDVVLLGFTTCLGKLGYPLRLAMSISALAGGSIRTEPWSGGSTFAAPLPCAQQSCTVGAYWVQNSW